MSSHGCAPAAALTLAVDLGQHIACGMAVPAGHAVVRGEQGTVSRVHGAGALPAQTLLGWSPAAASIC
jgi:hypothetical protein